MWYDYGHKALALGVLYLMNKGLATATKRAGIAFPSPLIGESCRGTAGLVHADPSETLREVCQWPQDELIASPTCALF